MATHDPTKRAEELNFARHKNKFGTPVPPRRGSSDGTPEGDAKGATYERGIPLDKAPREERASSDSIMDVPS